MGISVLRQLFSIRDIRNAAMGLGVVIGGLALASLTVIAHRQDNARLAGIAAALSLVFVLLILIFVVPPLARSASREASQLNLPFEFTLGGAVMVAMIAIVGFSAWNTGNNLLFLVFSFLIAAMVVGFITGSLTLKRLDVKMRFPETIFAGEPTVVLVGLQNRKRWFSSNSVIAEVRGTEREESIAAGDLKRLLPEFIAKRLSGPPVVRRTLDYFIRVPRQSFIESRATHIFEKRGRLLIKDFELSTRYPFGFFRHRRRLPARETELIVLPSVERMPHDVPDLDLEAGNLAAGKKGSGQELLALREYIVNDDMRRVDWKATARSRRIIVRDFAAENEMRITLVFDPRMPEGRRSRMPLRLKLEAEQDGRDLLHSERFENGVSRAAAILSHFSEEQAETRLVVGDDVGPYGMGSRHLYDSLKRLALVAPTFVDRRDPKPPGNVVRDLFNEADKSHHFVLSSFPSSAFPDEMTSNSRFIRY